MKIDLSFWRFVIILQIAKSGIWYKGEDTYILHVGTFTNGVDTGVKIIFLPFSLMIGVV